MEQLGANLEILNTHFRLPQIPDLLTRKRTGEEKGTLDGADLAFHQSEFARLMALLEQAGKDSALPEQPSAKEALSSILVRVRLAPNA